MAQIKKVSGTITTQNLNPNSGVPTAGSYVSSRAINLSTLTIQTFGTYTGALSVQARNDGTNWKTLGGSSIIDITTATGASTIPSAAQSIYQVDISGFDDVRVTALAAVTGSVAVTLRLTESPTVFTIDNSLTVGAVTPGSSATNLGKAEDAVHTSGDVGVAMLGVRYETQGTSPVSAAGDYGFIQIDDLAKAVVQPYAPPVNQVQGTTAAITGTADTAVIAAGGAGVRNYITSVTMVNSSATATVIELKDGSTVIWRGYVPANGYNDAQFPTPLKGTAATAINVACLTTATNTYVTCTGFRAL